MSKHLTTGIILSFTAIYVIWGTTYLAIRFALEDFPPFMMTAIRFVTAGGLLYGFLRIRGLEKPPFKAWQHAAISGCLLFIGGQGLVVLAEQTVPSGITALVISIAPLFIVLADWLWPGGKRPSSSVFIGIVIGFAGIFLLLNPLEILDHTVLDGVGILFIIGACTCWANGTIYSRRIPIHDSAFATASMQMLCAGIVASLISVGIGEHHEAFAQSPSLLGLTSLAFLILCGSIIAISAYVWLLRKVSPAKVSTYAYVNPVIAMFVGWALANEELTSNTLLAAAIILLAVVILVSRKSN